MVWDRLSGLYDLFETVYNGKCYKNSAKEIEKYVNENDNVLECACGTGILSVPMAKKCCHLTATDYSDGMLKQARKKLKKYSNATVEKESILELSYPDNTFDLVVAANVIHLLDEPEKALGELRRVCKEGGRMVIPTYINKSKPEATRGAKFVSKLGVSFAREFDIETYKKFFSDLGYENVEYSVVDGRMPCAFALIKEGK